MQRVPSALLLETDNVAPLSRLFSSSGMRGDAPRRALFRFILSLISGVELRGRDCTFTYHLFQLESAEAILDCTFLIHVLLGRFFFSILRRVVLPSAPPSPFILESLH